MFLKTCTMDYLAMISSWDNPIDNMWPGDRLKYLKDRQDNKDYWMYIGYNSDILPVAWGQIKVEEDCYVLSWFVKKEEREKGYGMELARLLTHMCVGKPIKAKINTNRPYSERIACRLWMVPEGELLETGEKWWVRH